jgi:hypothetical protein
MKFRVNTVKTAAATVTAMMLFTVGAYANQLDAPVLTQQTFGSANTQRVIAWDEVEGADSYSVFLYARPFNSPRFPAPGESLDDQIAAGLVVRVAYVHGLSAGVLGTPLVAGNDDVTSYGTYDLRFMNFNAYDGNTWAINPVPLRYPQGPFEWNMPPGASLGNLMPGAYWVRVQAVAGLETSPYSDWWIPTEASQGHVVGMETPVIISLGPTLGREMMESGDARMIDVRPNPERDQQAILRFNEWYTGAHMVNQSGQALYAPPGVPADLWGGNDVRETWTNPNELLLIL